MQGKRFFTVGHWPNWLYPAGVIVVVKSMAPGLCLSTWFEYSKTPRRVPGDLAFSWWLAESFFEEAFDAVGLGSWVSAWTG